MGSPVRSEVEGVVPVAAWYVLSPGRQGCPRSPRVNLNSGSRWNSQAPANLNTVPRRSLISEVDLLRGWWLAVLRGFVHFPGLEWFPGVPSAALSSIRRENGPRPRFCEEQVTAAGLASLRSTVVPSSALVWPSVPGVRRPGGAGTPEERLTDERRAEMWHLTPPQKRRKACRLQQHRWASGHAATRDASEDDRHW